MKNKETSGGKKLPPVSFSLLPSEDRPSAAKKPGKGWPVWGSALAAVVLVGLARGGLEVAASGRRVDVNRLDEKIATATTALETARRGAKDAEALGRRIASVKKLLGEHRHFTAFLAALEQATIPEVSYLNLDADTEKSVQLQAVATDFAAAARQIRAAELSPAVAAASVESVSAVFDDRGNIEGVKFTLTLTPKL